MNWEASAEPYLPYTPDEFAGYDCTACPNCDFMLETEQECTICGWTKDDPA